MRRLRAPRAVVDEMIDLHRNRGVPIFLFQDDDFLAGGRKAKAWAMEIADLIAKDGLTGKMAFKISCRSDEIHEEVIERLIAGGLTHVYMGVESGDEEGLINMSKRLKPEAHLRAGRILKSFGLSFDFGFMLVDPYSFVPQHSTECSFSRGVHRRWLDSGAVLPDAALRRHADQATTRIGRTYAWYVIRSRLQVSRSEARSVLRLDGENVLRAKLYEPGLVPHFERFALRSTSPVVFT